MTKTSEIREKMRAGIRPADLIAMGFKRGLVYILSKMLRDKPRRHDIVG